MFVYKPTGCGFESSYSHVDTFNLALNSNFAKLKAEVDKMDVDRLKTVSFVLSKVSIVVNNGVDKKTLCDKLVSKINNIYTSGLF